MSHANGDNLTTTAPSTTKGIREERSRLRLGTSRHPTYDSTVPPSTLPAVPQRLTQGAHPLPEKSSLTDKTWVKQRESQPQIHTLRPRARSVLIGRRMRGHFNQNLPPCGRGGRERQKFACARMLEGELPGMKAKHIPAPSVTVLRIPHDRMSRLREMDTDLVLASAFERHLDERGGRTPSTGLHPRLRDDSPLRAGELAVSGILHAPH